MNKLVEEIQLGPTIRALVMDALFSMGIVKTGICDGGHKRYDDSGLHRINQIF